MASLSDVNKKVREIVREMLDMGTNTVRPADQKSPTGDRDLQFATVKIISFDSRGWDSHRFEDQDSPSTLIDETIVGLRRFTASIQFYRGDAYTKACRLEALLQSARATELLQLAGLGYVRCSAVRNLTGVVDTYPEERGQVDVDFYVVADEVVSIESYNVFPISTTTETGDDTHLTTNSEVTDE